MSTTLFAAKTGLDGTTHEQTIICRQLFACHAVGSRPMERKKKMHRMIIVVVVLVVFVVEHITPFSVTYSGGKH